MLEIEPMADWLAMGASLLGGGAAAGAALYVVGRRVQRRTAVVAARAAAEESKRLLEDARQRLVLAAKEELIAPCLEFGALLRIPSAISTRCPQAAGCIPRVALRFLKRQRALQCAFLLRAIL